MTYLLINNQTNVIENIIDLDPQIQNSDKAWPIPEGYKVIQADGSELIGNIYQ